MYDTTIRRVENAIRIGLLETNSVTERTAKMTAKQDVDQNPQCTDASSVHRVDRHEGVGKTWDAGRIRESCVERLGAGHLVLHRTVGTQRRRKLLS